MAKSISIRVTTDECSMLKEWQKNKKKFYQLMGMIEF